MNCIVIDHTCGFSASLGPGSRAAPTKGGGFMETSRGSWPRMSSLFSRTCRTGLLVDSGRKWPKVPWLRIYWPWPSWKGRRGRAQSAWGCQWSGWPWHHSVSWTRLHTLTDSPLRLQCRLPGKLIYTSLFPSIQRRIISENETNQSHKYRFSRNLKKN